MAPTKKRPTLLSPESDKENLKNSKKADTFCLETEAINASDCESVQSEYNCWTSGENLSGGEQSEVSECSSDDENIPITSRETRSKRLFSSSNFPAATKRSIKSSRKSSKKNNSPSNGLTLRKRKNINYNERLFFESIFKDFVEDRNGSNSSSDEKEISHVAPVKKSKSRESCPEMSLDNIAGLDELKKRLKETIVLPLKCPDLFKSQNIIPPKGLLFYGPPGTGKTTIARLIAKESNLTFYYRNGGECLNKWMGEAEGKLKKLFEEAKKSAPSIIFFDEIDAIIPARTTKMDQCHVTLVSTMLSLMDGLESRGEVIVIGATNRIDSIDAAFRRPGRFDREFYFPLPNLESRLEIISMNTKNWPNAPSRKVCLGIAEKSKGFSGADIKVSCQLIPKNLCIEAFFRALRRDRPHIYSQPIESSIEAPHVIEEDFYAALEECKVQILKNSANRLTFSNIPKYLRDQHSHQIHDLFIQISLYFTSNSQSNRLLVHGSSPLSIGVSIIVSEALAELEDVFVKTIDPFTVINGANKSSEEEFKSCISEALSMPKSVIHLRNLDKWIKIFPDSFILLLDYFIKDCFIPQNHLIIASVDKVTSQLIHHWTEKSEFYVIE